jgi:mRNA-degrading endonuclease RelE of RelBE toxin-antitoxin system
VYSPEAEEHLRTFTTRQQAIVLDTVDQQLMYEPTVETRNRKPMRPNPLAPWELRIGDLRVYYDIQPDSSDESDAVGESEPSQSTVLVVAVGVKERNRVRIGGEVFEL